MLWCYRAPKYERIIWTVSDKNILYWRYQDLRGEQFVRCGRGNHHFPWHMVLCHVSAGSRGTAGLQRISGPIAIFRRLPYLYMMNHSFPVLFGRFLASNHRSTMKIFKYDGTDFIFAHITVQPKHPFHAHAAWVQAVYGPNKILIGKWSKTFCDGLSRISSVTSDNSGRYVMRWLLTQ